MSLIKNVAQQARRTNVVASKASSSGVYPLGGYNENKAQLRRETTAQYYRDHDIHHAAKKDSVRLKAAALLFTGRIPSNIDLIRSAQYLQSELPVRIAHRIKGFRSLPFIVVTNPHILKVMEQYIRSFKVISNFNDGRMVKTQDKVDDFTHLLEILLDEHGSVIDDLTQGFSSCHDHILEIFDGDEEKTHDLVQSFLDKTLTSRLGIRLLAQHHLLLKDQIGQNSKYFIPKRDRIGIVESRWKPAKDIEAIARKIRESWMFHCDNPPRVKLNGHTEAEFPYIPIGVDYILQEVFKNAFRAVIEAHANSARQMPPIDVTIAVNREDFTIRIADRGKGMKSDVIDKIWRYHFTTARGRQGYGGVGDLLSMANSNEKELAGYGIGLPISKAYAEYLGGKLEIKSMSGIGTDVYLTLKHIDPHKGHSFRI
ncbi:Oidioi.mRNA.OKI2018_I69.chr1.g499.t1.cds [Oikopleura dioica]|uniref:Protein-serine/threonine kinase n=1 Tax=Oikopleura dioica TaxID=34765 RepID=A0ABN7SPA2_OIKDI|nr:Oidioi.mRNA.OKI2018_I69.chr1.g499.t1.cds [Oikopleura dioica]